MKLVMHLLHNTYQLLLLLFSLNKTETEFMDIISEFTYSTVTYNLALTVPHSDIVIYVKKYIFGLYPCWWHRVPKNLEIL